MSWNIEMREKSPMSNREDGTITLMRSQNLRQALRYLWDYRAFFFGRKPYFGDRILTVVRASRED
jgi:hypothetical protein